MDFRLNEQQRDLQEAARRFAQEQLPMLARELEDTAEPVPHAWVKRYAEMGFLGINVSPDYGGLGLGNLEALLVVEEFAKISSAVAFPVFESCVGPARAIEHFAPEALRKRVMPAVCSGEMVVAIGMSEPDAGSALTDLKTNAVVNGDKVVLNGSKRWCSGGGHANGYVIYCRFDNAPGAKGIGAVFVEKGAKGFSFGPQEKLMGFRGVPSSDLYFDNVELPLDNIVTPGGGFKKLMEAFDLERCGNATMALGQASGALEDVLAYVKERKQFGRPIVEFQAVQLKLAEMKMKVEAARLLIQRAARNAEEGMPSIMDSSLAKCFANEIAREVAGSAVQLMGGYGYSKEYPMERRLRDAWGWGIAGGAIDIQKVNIAAAMVGNAIRPEARLSDMSEYEDVASLHQIRDGGVLFVDAGESEAMLFRSGDNVKAYGAYCTHAFASLRDAKIEGTMITCARHGARFDLTTGRAVSGGCPNLPSYSVKREGMRVLVKAK